VESYISWELQESGAADRAAESAQGIIAETRGEAKARRVSKSADYVDGSQARQRH